MRKFLMILLALFLIGGSIGYYLFNKKVATLEDAKPDFVLNSDQLFDSFDQNEQEAQAKYGDKIIEVSGEVLRINLKDSLPTVTLKAENSMIGGVNCTFANELDQVETGDLITVRCQCQGYLMDVILNNCTLIK